MGSRRGGGVWAEIRACCSSVTGPLTWGWKEQRGGTHWRSKGGIAAGPWNRSEFCFCVLLCRLFKTSEGAVSGTAQRHNHFNCTVT